MAGLSCEIEGRLRDSQGPIRKSRIEFNRILLVVVIMLSPIVGTACSGSGDVSGNIFLTMKSGDVKRAAGIQVILVPATEQFESDWKKLVADFKVEYGKAEVGYKDASRADEDARRRRIEDIGRGNFSSSTGNEFNNMLGWMDYQAKVRQTYLARAKGLAWKIHEK